jgi:uridine kinase
MKTHLKIGKAIINNFADYAEENFLDDETEYFPAVKIIIEGIVKSYDGSQKDKETLKKALTDPLKQRFIETWIKQAKEEESDPDIEMETGEAIEVFNERYFIN